MAWVAPSNVATNDLITAAKWNQDVVANTTYLGNTHDHKTAVGGGGGGAIVQPFVTVYGSSPMSIPNNSDTVVTFDSDLSDADGFHSTVSNTSRLTVPAGLGGKYLIWQHVPFTANANGVRKWQFLKNGSQVGSYVVRTAISGQVMVGDSSILLVLVATDYVEIAVYQNSGDVLALDNAYAGESQFGMFRVSA